MSAAGRLLAQLPKLLGAIRSGRPVPISLRADVAVFLELKLEASRGRAESGARNAAGRWAVNHERVRKALGVAPLDYSLEHLVTVVSVRMAGKPMQRRTIEAHLLAWREELSITEPKRTRRCATVNASTEKEEG